MEFFSPRFFAFLPAILVALAVLKGAAARRLFLSLASCFFYAVWDWRYLGLLLAVSAIDYLAASAMASSQCRRRRRIWLAVSLMSNLAILGYFKYVDFFLESYNRLLGDRLGSIPLLAVVLPAGISFYTFKTMSYTLDVYWGRLPACRSWLDYALYVSFFPDLIAGPIVRASSFLPQLAGNPGPSRQRLIEGGNLFLQGLTKKLLVADRLGEQIRPVFECPEVFSSGSMWLAVLAYAGQIYCDFSGYSDMATGTAHMLGYHLPLNFNLPYVSRDVSEFWRRWHITLSQWLRDYLYIPLGGDGRAGGNAYRSLMITMLLGGLWHGAAWTFVLWGGLHGLALCLHRLWRRSGRRLPSAPAWLLTFGFVVLAWVPFRCDGREMMMTSYQRLLGWNGTQGQQIDPHWTAICLGLILAGHALNLSLPRLRNWRGLSWLGLSVVELPLAGSYLCFTQLTFLSGFLLTLWSGLLFLFAATEVNPFIYFQF